jgi:ubiquinone/menaquinone biosynthesis C-methylase UbiE
MNRIHHWICRSRVWRLAVGKLVPWTLGNADLGQHLLEIGPGPGLTTELLRQRVPRLTAIEIDATLAASLRDKPQFTNVRVVEGDATRMPFTDSAFTAAVAFTMLHHVPSPELQDRLFAEVFRTLQPGGTFLGTDSVASWILKLLHIHDTLVLVDPAKLPERLEHAGFRDIDVEVETAARRFRFRARKPQ